MTYTIKNEYLEATVNELGAELISLKSADGCEYIWQGDPKYWQGHAPIMFPFCGRLWEGKYTYLGKEYSLGNHGFARHSLFSLYSAKESEITLLLKSDEQTKQNYPFDFLFYVTFSLKGKELKISHRVENKDEKDLIFAIGGHPAFNVPLGGEGKFEDWYLELDKKCEAIRVDLSEKCFRTGNDKPYLSEGVKKIPLSHSLFDRDAIFLYNVPKRVSLLSEKSRRGVRVSFNDMKYVGFWHMPRTDAPYVCIEPWTSQPSYDGAVDSLSTKAEMICLPSGYSFKNGYSIEVI